MIGAQLDRIDPSFLDDLDASRNALWKVARHLSAVGHEVTVPPTVKRGPDDAIARFADRGDIWIRWRSRRFRVEVKHRPGLRFHDIGSFPYQGETIVDVAHAWDAANPKPVAYYVCNADLTGALLIRGSTFRHWRRESRPDRTRHRIRTFLFCPLCLCNYVQFRD